jgi:glutaredoxin
MLRRLSGRQAKKVVIYTQPTWADCHAARGFFALQGIEYEERDVTTGKKHMKELTETIGRTATPTIVIGHEVLVRFAAD